MTRSTNQGKCFTRKTAVDYEPIHLTENARSVVESKYVLKSPHDGTTPIESVAEMFFRVASNIALGETEPSLREKWTERFMEALTRLDFLPNLPTFLGAGTPLGQLSACFVLDIEDNLEDILEIQKTGAMIQKSGGGIGYYFGNLRESGALIASSKGKSCGPIGFLESYAHLFKTVQCGGVRRGANIAILPVTHPDIRQFIVCKKEEHLLECFNVSVSATDDFMRAVQNDESYDLVSPATGSVVQRESAREILEEIAYYAWNKGDPGMIFHDRANETNPVPQLYDLRAPNPCLVGDSWVVTRYDGPMQIKDLQGKAVDILSNGVFVRTSDEGFFVTGCRRVMEIETEKGYRIQVTKEHLMNVPAKPSSSSQRSDSDKISTTWKEAGNLSIGDEIMLGSSASLSPQTSTTTPHPPMKDGITDYLSTNDMAFWNGAGTRNEGYLVGLLASMAQHGICLESLYQSISPSSSSIVVDDKQPLSIPVFSKEEEFTFIGGTTLDKLFWHHLNLMRENEDLNAFGFQDIMCIAQSYNLYMLPDSPSVSDSSDTDDIDYQPDSDSFISLYRGISPSIERTSSAFHVGFLSAFLEANGRWNNTTNELLKVGDGGGDGPSLQISFSNGEILRGVQRMLQRLGCISTLGTYGSKDETFLTSPPPSSDCFEDGHYISMVADASSRYHFLTIENQNFVQCLCLFDRTMDKLYSEYLWFTRLTNNHGGDDDSRDTSMVRPQTCVPPSIRLGAFPPETFVDKVRFISHFDGQKKVFDAQVPGVHAFDANGFHVHNCGEQFLGHKESCTLGSINLAQMLIPMHDEPILLCDRKRGMAVKYAVDWIRFRKLIRHSVRFLDLVLTQNKYIAYDPSIREAALLTRRIGLGVTGYADILYRLGLPYGSEEALRFSEDLMEFFQFHSMLTSCELAREKGAFPACKDSSVFNPTAFSWKSPKRQFDRGDYTSHLPHSFGPTAAAAAADIPSEYEDPLDALSKFLFVRDGSWELLIEAIKRHGIRNATVTCVAPTGSISTVMATEGYGLEPLFALAHIRKFKDPFDDNSYKELPYYSPIFNEALHQLKNTKLITEDEFKRCSEHVARTGSCQQLTFLPEEFRRVFGVSFDIDPFLHIDTQATFQRFLCNSVSKTINLPHDWTSSKVAECYMYAWEKGCKGITVFRKGCREKNVLETQEASSTPLDVDVDHDDDDDGVTQEMDLLKITTPQSESDSQSIPMFEHELGDSLIPEEEQPSNELTEGSTHGDDDDDKVQAADEDTENTSGTKLCHKCFRPVPRLVGCTICISCGFKDCSM